MLCQAVKNSHHSLIITIPLPSNPGLALSLHCIFSSFAVMLTIYCILQLVVVSYYYFQNAAADQVSKVKLQVNSENYISGFDIRNA